MIKTASEIACIRESSEIVAKALRLAGRMIEPGITTKEIDDEIERFIRNQGGTPAFKNYSENGRRFPASSCISINDEVIHGIPSKYKTIEEGDIVSVDIGVYKNGYYGDGAKTFPVDDISNIKERLIDVTENALLLAIDEIYDGMPIRDLSGIIEDYIRTHGFHVVKKYVGHGVGTSLHESPAIPNYYNRSTIGTLNAGMTVAIEPMVTCQSSGVYMDQDGWTVLSDDGRPSAHFEHTVLITRKKAEILTI